jgi:hypothetical protein
MFFSLLTFGYFCFQIFASSGMTFVVRIVKLQNQSSFDSSKFVENLVTFMLALNALLMLKNN